MKNNVLKIFSILALLLAPSAVQAEGLAVGGSVFWAQVETSGSESEKSGDVGPETNSKTIEENIAGASIFVEYGFSNGLTIGLDYIPVDQEIGEGTRTDAASGTDDGLLNAGVDTGERKASADLEDLVTLYVEYAPFDNGLYAKVGYMEVDVTTNETLPTSSYGNASVEGYMAGLGIKGDYGSGFAKLELNYRDFDEVSLSASSGSSTVKADADALTLGVSMGYNF